MSFLRNLLRDISLLPRKTPQLFQHYKGGALYEYLGLALLEATGEPVVRYRKWDPTGLYVNQDPEWVRTLASWDFQILWPDGVIRPRFCYTRAGVMNPYHRYENVPSLPPRNS